MELEADYNRRFTWGEICFLKMFYEDKTNDDQMQTRIWYLIRSGRLEIVGGGWVQHDETLTNYKMQIT